MRTILPSPTWAPGEREAALAELSQHRELEEAVEGGQEENSGEGDSGWSVVPGVGR